jgi:glucans biosynthesis protein C
MTERRYDVDWLRVGATYLLFVFHVGKVFDPAPFYHVRNAEVSFGMLVLCGFIGLWHMPLFFLLAGWSAVSSLRVRGSRGFMRERLLKLALPLVAGCVLLMPAIKYVELSSGLDLNHAGFRVSESLQGSFRQVIPSGLAVAPPFTESFVEFLPTFFTRLDRFTWAHLWFVAYLFTFTVVYRPLVLWLMSRPWRQMQPRPWWIYAPAILLVVIQVTLRPYWPGIQNLYDDWANVAYYSTYLLAGVVLSCAPSIEAVAHEEWKRALAIAGASTLVLLAAVLAGGDRPYVLLAGSAVAGWCWVVASLGLARRLLSFTSRRLDYLSESAFPVYVLHQAAIVFIGYGVVRLSLGIAAKYALLLATSVVATLAVYHFLVRPFGVPRLLLGMKAKRCAPRAIPRVSATVAVLAGVVLLASSAYAKTPEGLWYAEGGAATVRLERCGDALCGRIASLRSPFDENGCSQRDARNPDPSLRSRALEGLPILQGLERSPTDADVWLGGTIYDPASGTTYRCRLTVDGDRVHLRGYVGVPLFGRTATWIRVGAEDRVCRQRSAP